MPNPPGFKKIRESFSTDPSVIFSVHKTIICFRRFCYKKPEVLKDQANVYSMKVSEKPEIKPEVRHLPMRLEPARLPHVEDSGEPGTGEICQLCV